MWNSPAAVVRLIDDHLTRYPAMEPADIYKLLYQGVLGPEHLIASPEAFAARLRAEYGTVPPDEAELLWEPVRPDGALGRVNLRPFKAGGGDVERLIAACLEAAGRTWGTPTELQAAWVTFVESCRAGRWASLPLTGVLALSERLAAEGYLPIHHSPAYRQAYRPAYRLVAGGKGNLQQAADGSEWIVILSGQASKRANLTAVGMGPWRSSTSPPLAPPNEPVSRASK